MRSLRVVGWVVAAALLACGLTIAALAADARFLHDARWPFAGRAMQIVQFDLPPGIDGEALAAAARRELSGYDAWVEDFGGGPELFVGRETEAPERERVAAWARTHGLDPGEAGFGGWGESAPDWFSKPRRGHDLRWAGACAAAAALAGALCHRRRRTPCTSPVSGDCG